ncbi:hypothetical protein PV325_002118 [Microctonus aethiopoides]|nr:hypothetical protein PV325_002118 [Microctonus aethiopoides]
MEFNMVLHFDSVPKQLPSPRLTTQAMRHFVEPPLVSITFSPVSPRDFEYEFAMNNSAISLVADCRERKFGREQNGSDGWSIVEKWGIYGGVMQCRGSVVGPRVESTKAKDGGFTGWSRAHVKIGEEKT